MLVLTSPPDDIYDEDRDYKPTPCLSLSHTCHQFREIALSSPNAWVLIPVECNIDWTRECLRRSRPMPVSFVTELEARWTDTPRKRERAKMLALRELHRIRVLSLPGEDPSICHSLTRRAPELEFLSFGFHDMGSALPRNLFGAANTPLPKLKSVELTCVHIHPGAHLLRGSTLTNLTIVICRLWEDADTMVSALSGLVNLELLHIEHSIVTRSLALAQNSAPESINLPRLKYLNLNNEFYQNLLVLHYLHLPQSLHACSLHNNTAPLEDLYSSMFQGFRELALPPLVRYMESIISAGHGALKLTLSVNFSYVDVAASWPLSTEGVLSGQFVEPDTEYNNPCMSVYVPHNGPNETRFTMDGRQTLDALVRGRAFYTSSRILSVEGNAEILSDPRAWTAAHHLPDIELLGLNRESAPGLALALSTSRDQMPSFPRLQAIRFDDVIFDDTDPVIPDTGEDPSLFDLSVEEEYTGDVQPPGPTTLDPLFDRLSIALEPWFTSDGFERIIIRKSTITDDMINTLRAKLGEGAVDWDGVRDGAKREEEEGSDNFQMYM